MIFGEEEEGAESEAEEEVVVCVWILIY